MKPKVEIKGMDEIQSVLKGLPDVYSDKLLQQAHMKASVPLVARIHRLAPVGKTGNLADSIGAVRAGKKGNMLGEVIVGPRRSGQYKGFAGHLVEYGTKKRRTRKGGNRGRTPAKPFEEPAFEDTKQEVQQIIQKELSASTQKFLTGKIR